MNSEHIKYFQSLNIFGLKGHCFEGQYLDE
jgi:hypothetical protein